MGIYDRQLMLYGGARNAVDVTCQSLVECILECYPKIESCDLQREVCLRHPATEVFCIEHDVPLLDVKGWLYKLPMPETIARGSRLCRNGQPPRKSTGEMRKAILSDPRRQWYALYLETRHWQLVKEQATYLWEDRGHDPTRCLLNDEHIAKEWHHRTYTNIGDERKEIYDILPLCEQCHESVKCISATRPTSPPAAAWKHCVTELQKLRDILG